MIKVGTGVAITNGTFAGSGGVSTNVYNRPGGTDEYRRPGGTDKYNRPL